MAYLEARGRVLDLCWYERDETRPRCESTGFTVDQRREAEEFLATFEAELERQTAAARAAAPQANRARGITFEEYGKAWVERRRLASKMDWIQDERRLRLHAYPVIGHPALHAITRPMMLAYVKGLPAR